jgi:molybdate transport system ATP-binding protein
LGEPLATALPKGRPAPHLSVHMRHRIGALEVDVDFKLTRPWTILFGPSGSGKTTILRAIAGLLRPNFARIVDACGPVESGPIESGVKPSEMSATLVDTGAGVFVPAHRRHIHLAAQSANLLPHLTVRENIRYGRPAERSPDVQSHLDIQFAALLNDLQVSSLAEKLPRQLSGGEAQRVSLARAVAAGPTRFLLLDEPFTGLDLELRDSLIAKLQGWQSGSRVPVLSVTHDVAEAFQLDAEVIKLRAGRVVEQGPVATVLAEERARLLQQLIPAE